MTTVPGTTQTGTAQRNGGSGRVPKSVCGVLPTHAAQEGHVNFASRASRKRRIQFILFRFSEEMLYAE